MNYDTIIISFMSKEPRRPSYNKYDSYLERELDEHRLQKRYEEVYKELT